jgi:hypothetical protein
MVIQTAVSAIRSAKRQKRKVSQKYSAKMHDRLYELCIRYPCVKPWERAFFATSIAFRHSGWQVMQNCLTAIFQKNEG